MITHTYFSLFIYLLIGFWYIYVSSEQSHLDPNDPANADIMNIIKVLKQFRYSLPHIVFSVLQGLTFFFLLKSFTIRKCRRIVRNAALARLDCFNLTRVSKLLYNKFSDAQKRFFFPFFLCAANFLCLS